MKVDEGYADRVLHEAMTAAMGGLDPERVEAAITASEGTDQTGPRRGRA